MFFTALINTVRWLVFDQRKLLAAGFGDREVFELEMFLPNYISRHLSGDLSFHRRRLIFVRDPKRFGSVSKERGGSWVGVRPTHSSSHISATSRCWSRKVRITSTPSRQCTT